MNISLEQIKASVYDFINSGGNIYQSPRSSIPYYNLLNKYVKAHKKAGIQISIKDVYAQIGIFYDEIYDGLFSNLTKFSDENGYIDSFRNDRSVDGVYDKCKRAAKKMQIRLDEWVATMTPFYLHESLVRIDNYSQYLRDNLKIYFSTHSSINDIRTYDPELYNKLRHYRQYAEFGAFKTIEEAVGFLGFDYNPTNATKVGYSINDTLLRDVLLKLYPNKEINSFSDQAIYKKVLNHALYYDLSICEYLKKLGFVYNVESAKRSKLAYMKIIDSSKQTELKNIYKNFANNLNFNFEFFKFDLLPAQEKISLLEDQIHIAKSVVDDYYKHTNYKNKYNS